MRLLFSLITGVFNITPRCSEGLCSNTLTVCMCVVYPLLIMILMNPGRLTHLALSQIPLQGDTTIIHQQKVPRSSLDWPSAEHSRHVIRSSRSLVSVSVSFHPAGSGSCRGIAWSSVMSRVTSWPAPGSEKVWINAVEHKGALFSVEFACSAALWLLSLRVFL